MWLKILAEVCRSQFEVSGATHVPTRVEPGQEQAAGLLLGSPPQDPPPSCSCAGRQRERLLVLHQSAAKAGGRGQHGMRPGGSCSTLSWGVTCLLKACLSNNRCNPGLKDKGQGAAAEKVRARCY